MSSSPFRQTLIIAAFSSVGALAARLVVPVSFLTARFFLSRSIAISRASCEAVSYVSVFSLSGVTYISILIIADDDVLLYLNLRRCCFLREHVGQIGKLIFRTAELENVIDRFEINFLFARFRFHWGYA